MTFLESVSFFNNVKASQFPSVLPFEISDRGIGTDTTAFRHEVYRMAKKGSQVVIDSFNDGNNEFEVILDVGDNLVQRIGFGSFEYTLAEALEKKVISVDHITGYFEANQLTTLCSDYVKRVQSSS